MPDMQEPNEKMLEAIAFFEQMLQTMPEDRTSLEFLSVAYEQTGQIEKQRDCLVRLADCLLHEKDFDKAQSIALHLSQFSDYAPARAAIARVTECVQNEIVSEAVKASPKKGAATVLPASDKGAFQDVGLEVHALSRAASAAEMELVWHLKEHELVPKEICMDLLHILTENQVTDQPILISALALLNEQHPELTDRVIESLSRSSGVPPIPLELFEIPSAATGAISPVFVHVRGVLPFARLGDELMVAVLNPLSQSLQVEVSARTGKVCHFFLAHPNVWGEIAKRI